MTNQHNVFYVSFIAGLSGARTHLGMNGSSILILRQKQEIDLEIACGRCHLLPKNVTLSLPLPFPSPYWQTSATAKVPNVIDLYQLMSTVA